MMEQANSRHHDLGANWTVTFLMDGSAIFYNFQESNQRLHLSRTSLDTLRDILRSSASVEA